MIARGVDLFVELLLGLDENLGIVELERPVNGILGPDEQTHAIGGAQHGFIVRIVREADEVAAELFRPAKKRLRILVRVCATGAIGRFSVDGNAAQKDRLAVEQDFGATRFDGAEAHQLVDGVGCPRESRPYRVWVIPASSAQGPAR